MDDLEQAVPGNLAILRTEGEVLAALASGHWDAGVAACPGWTAGAAMIHTGSVHRWVETIMRTGQPTPRRDLPGPPDGRDAALAWYRDGVAVLLDRFEATDPAGEVWAFAASGERRVAWWARRMAQETSMHRWDVAAAAHASEGAAPVAIEPVVAADGIEEYLVDFLPGRGADAAAGVHGTLHLHATDVQTANAGEWYLDLDDLAAPVRHEHGKADTALRGTANDLLLWLWNRQAAAGHLDAFGDDSVVSGWTAIAV